MPGTFEREANEEGGVHARKKNLKLRKSLKKKIQKILAPVCKCMKVSSKMQMVFLK